MSRQLPAALGDDGLKVPREFTTSPTIAADFDMAPME
jgi:hypothetical protein